MRPSCARIAELTRATGPDSIVLRPNRAMDLSDLRRRNGFIRGIWADAREWSAACLRGEVPEFSPDPDVAEWLTWAREQKKENGESEFPELLKLYLADRFAAQNDLPRTVEAVPLTDADQLLVSVTLLDSPQERQWYSGRSQRPRQPYSPPEPTPHDYMAD